MVMVNAVRTDGAPGTDLQFGRLEHDLAALEFLGRGLVVVVPLDVHA
jgi:hypothetical protein